MDIFESKFYVTEMRSRYGFDIFKDLKPIRTFKELIENHTNNTLCSFKDMYVKSYLDQFELLKTEIELDELLTFAPRLLTLLSYETLNYFLTFFEENSSKRLDCLFRRDTIVDLDVICEIYKQYIKEAILYKFEHDIKKDESDIINVRSNLISIDKIDSILKLKPVERQKILRENKLICGYGSQNRLVRRQPVLYNEFLNFIKNSYVGDKTKFINQGTYFSFLSFVEPDVLIDLIGISKRQLKSKLDNYKIPYYKFTNDRWLFDIDDVNKIVIPILKKSSTEPN